MHSILLNLLKQYWHDGRTTIFVVFVSTLVGALATVAAPYLFSRAIDEFVTSPNQVDVLQFLLFYSLLFGCAKAFNQGARFLILLSAERLSLIANTSFFVRLLRKRPEFFLKHNAAEIGTARQQGTQTLNIITQLMLGGILPGCVQVAFSVALLGKLVSWDIALIVLGYGVVVVILDYIRLSKVKNTLRAAMEGSQSSAHLVGNVIAVIDMVRQTSSEHWLSQRFAGTARETFIRWQRYALISSAFCGILGVAAALQLALTFLILVPRYEAGLISIGGIVLFNTLLVQLNEPFHLIGMAIKETTEAAARFRPLSTMWNAPEELEPTDPLPYSPAYGIVSFENVTFQYPNGRGVSNLSFTARRGTPNFLTGETGAGKSTILRLLVKGLLPTEGRILVDGTDLARVKNQDWLPYVGVVPQDIVLLNDTLTVNIVLGRPFDEELLRRVAEQASILARIDVMPEGFNTVVGERGLKLSGGERQRIAIARALYSQPSILLLDEASSALDDYTEKLIMDGLRNLADRLTIIAITHRTSVIQDGDQIIRLDSVT